MQIDPKFKIGQKVQLSSMVGTVICIVVTPQGLLYEFSYFDGDYKTVRCYECELSECESFGFKFTKENLRVEHSELYS